ncbi:MAG: aspartate/glutamate racemase family protein [Alphaproteobacteria bacterium]|nr:aspartate/glutamate racemase family protein [Alphaproteobacteria bacterium]MBV9903178.1 aspartate/glutamate racemase family protein [Alphaproteobacteria bacterium]
MKTIGMLGGMSWESSSVYYQLINREVQKRVGGVASAKTLMYSFDFGEIAPLQNAGEWAAANARMVEGVKALERGGADFLIMCCNTMHCATPDIEAATKLPFLHIADPLGAAIKQADMRRVGLLGSAYTMTQEGIIIGRLKRYGIETIVPDGKDAAETSRVIYDELIRGRFLESSRANYREIIARLIARGAEGIVMGCTEIPLLLKPEDSAVPLFDTTTLHAMAAVDRALA